jgi:hypothetical protein
MGKEDRRQKVRIQKSEVRIPAPGNGVDVGELRLRGTEAQEDRSQEAEVTELPRTPNGEP